MELITGNIYSKGYEDPLNPNTAQNDKPILSAQKDCPEQYIPEQILLCNPKFRQRTKPATHIRVLPGHASHSLLICDYFIIIVTPPFNYSNRIMTYLA